MSYLAYIFVIIISLCLIHRDRGKTSEYLAWLIISILIFTGVVL